MKKIFAIILVIFCMILCSFSYADFNTSLPADIGSTHNLMEILYPEDKKVTSYSESYIISCIAEPGTVITLYERYDDNLFVPMLVNNEAITGTVGESGLYLIDMRFKPNSTNKIMFFAQKGKKYQSIFRTIIISEPKVEEAPKVEYKVLDIQEFVKSIENGMPI